MPRVVFLVWHAMINGVCPAGCIHGSAAGEVPYSTPLFPFSFGGVLCSLLTRLHLWGGRKRSVGFPQVVLLVRISPGEPSQGLISLGENVQLKDRLLCDSNWFTNKSKNKAFFPCVSPSSPGKPISFWVLRPVHTWISQPSLGSHAGSSAGSCS